MTYRAKTLLVAGLFAVTAACNRGRYATADFHLPPDGNADHGKAAFVALGCSTCHRVSGVNLPAPTVEPPVPVELGGEVIHRLSDAYLATSMMHPSFELAPYPKAQITSGGQSRMPAYTDQMTVRQMTDIVAFLQEHYTVPRDRQEDVTH
jgi:mono/diheme cytochrome c family protein